MDSSTGNPSFAPESPDLTNFYQDAPEPVPVPQQQYYRGSISHAPPYTPGSLITNQPYLPDQSNSYAFPQLQSPGTMPPQTRGRRVQYEEDDYTPESPPEPAHDYSSFPPDGNSDSSANTNADLGIIVKTKFPVARIKRIMQADEDVGKVAQVTPVAVSKALELFMINLVTKAASEARSRGQKRVTPAHLKQAITSDTQFDFLEDVVKKIADAPAATEKMDEDESGEPKKRKGAGRRKKKEDSEEL